MHAERIAVATVSILVVASLAVMGQSLETDTPALRLFARPTFSMMSVYVPPPHERARSRLYFVGEPLTVEMDIVNQSGAHAALVAENPSRGIQVQIRRQEGRLLFDGPIVDVRVRYGDQPSRVFEGIAQPQPLEHRMPLAPNEAIRWRADIDLEGIDPGVYVIELTPLVADESGVAVNARVSGIPFEVRERTSEATRDIMLRAGMRLWSEGKPQDAEWALRDMLGIFPTSSMAASALGELLATQGRRTEAREMFERARSILSAGADPPLTLTPDDSIPARLRGLDERIAQLSQ